MKKLRKRAGRGGLLGKTNLEPVPVKKWKIGKFDRNSTGWLMAVEKFFRYVEIMVENVENVENTKLSTFHKGHLGGIHGGSGRPFSCPGCF